MPEKKSEKRRVGAPTPVSREGEARRPRIRDDPELVRKMYKLKTEMVDRLNFEECQQRAAWEALTGYTPEQLRDTRNLDCFIAAHWEEAREEIASQVDDIEEAYAFFVCVWRKEFGAASEAAFQPSEEVA